MIARIILLAAAVSMVGTGVAFCGGAIYLLLLAFVGASAAAALTAVVLFLAVGAGITIHLAVTGRRTIAIPPAVKTVQSHDALVTALTQLAAERPLMAVACATALGLTDAMTRKVQ